MSADLIAVAGPEFVGTATHAETRLTAQLIGNADGGAIEPVATMLTELHDAAVRLAVEETVVDLRQLEFMNSSCFKSFVTWMTKVQALEPNRRYKVRFLSNPAMHWQKRSLHALRCFAVGLISVES